MKKFLLSTVALSAVSFGVSARSYMVVNHSDGADSDTFNVGKISEVTFFEVEDPEQGGVTISGSVGAYTYVDLGLPSGTKWATYNMGTNTPLEKGDYYAWGETKPKGSYTNANYKYWDADNKAYTKYVSGTEANPAILEAADDAATANWGATWCMPTDEQWEELIKNVTFKQVADFNETGVSGYLGTSKQNGSTIFFPGTGYSAGNKGTEGYAYYWTANSYDKAKATAYGNAGYWAKNTACTRYMGLCIRPVVSSAKNWKPTVTDSKGIYDYVDLGLESGTMWATKNIGASSLAGEGTMFFAWGEVKPKTEYAHDYSDYKYFQGTSITKYSDKGDAVLLSEDDAAAANTGVLRMPTKEEFQELSEGCTWSQEEEGIAGVDGPVLVGVSKTNGAIIVFPYVGSVTDGELDKEGSSGYYWTSTNIKEGIGANAYAAIALRRFLRVNSQAKFTGMAVRGVLAK